jgi:hypothetical protein
MKYEEVDNYFKQGLIKKVVNHNPYCMHKEARKMAILIIYVNDLLLTINNPKKIEWFFQQLINIFKTFQLGNMKLHVQINLSTFL